MQSISMIVKQFKEKRANLEIEYKKSCIYDGNLKAQELINKYFKKFLLNLEELEKLKIVVMN